MQPIRYCQTRRAERRISRSDGTGNYPQHSQYAANGTHHFRTDFINHIGRTVRQCRIQVAYRTVERNSCSSPDQSNNALGNHCAVKDRAPFPFRSHASCHHRRLRRMEPGNCTACHCHKHLCPNRNAAGMPHAFHSYIFPHFRHSRTVIPVEQHHCHQAHEDQHNPVTDRISPGTLHAPSTSNLYPIPQMVLISSPFSPSLLRSFFTWVSMVRASPK